MNPSDDNPKIEKDGVRRDPPRVAFTLVEMIVTLTVACILMVAVVAFLVNGVVSTTKTTAINDSTAKGRYVFEHLSREMARANDLTISPTPAGGVFRAEPDLRLPADAHARKPGPGLPGLQLHDSRRGPGDHPPPDSGHVRREPPDQPFPGRLVPPRLPGAPGGRLHPDPRAQPRVAESGGADSFRERARGERRRLR